MEQYLKDDYDVIDLMGEIIDPAEIVSYFEDCGEEYFDCGQGYYQDEAVVLVRVNYNYYEVCVEALVLGDKQDRGDKLYYVEEITSVKYKQIPMPLPKEQLKVTFEVTASAEKIRSLTHFIEEHNVLYKIL